MSCAKGKSGSTSRRYRATSHYDDATLAQKREYWRTKKREQRARLSEGRDTLKPDDGGEKLHLNGSLVASSSPLQENNKSCRIPAETPTPQSGQTPGGRTSETLHLPNAKQLRTQNLNKIPPQLPALGSISTKADGNKMTRGAENQSVTSPPKPSGIQLNATSSVPVVKLTTLTITNGSSAKETPQPRVSMQHPLVPQSHHKDQVAIHVQSQPLITNTASRGMQTTSTCSSVKIEGKAANAPPQSGMKSAWGSANRTKEDDSNQPSQESEEERAAKRREQWRLKKREQRAKLAARLTKAREKTQSGQAALPSARVLVQKLPSHLTTRGPGLRHSLARLYKVSCTSLKRDAGKFPTEPSNVTPAGLGKNLQTPQIRVRAPLYRSTLGEKKPAELSGSLPGFMRFSNAPRGIVRCKTPRQRFIEAHKIAMSQRNLRGKAYAFVSNSRNCPRIDPNDTPEQILAKRREYWRIKKREQRAKLSLEVKAHLKEKDSLMRRVKRYQTILEEIRRARAMGGGTLAQSPSCTFSHDSETIGGFIKEDGTVTVNIPQVPVGYGTTSHKREEEASNVFSGGNFRAQHNSTNIGIAPVQGNPPCRSLRPAQSRVQSTFGGQSASKTPPILSGRLRPRHEGTNTVLNNSATLAGQLKLAHPETLQNSPSTSGSSLGACVMKMAVSNNVASLSAPSVEAELTEEERMAKKREYWRVKKREQRAAHAVQLKQAALQRRKTPRPTQLQKGSTPVQLSGTLADSTQDGHSLSHSGTSVTLCTEVIKQESESVPAVDLNSEPEHAVCVEIKPSASRPQTPLIPSLQPEPDLALSTDSQATTLRAVASMKKLLEESLSSVSESKSPQSSVKLEQLPDQPESESSKTQGLSEQEIKSNLLQLFFGIDEEVPCAADVSVPAASPHAHSKDQPQIEPLPPVPSTNAVPLPSSSSSSSSSHASPYMQSCQDQHQSSTYKTHVLRPRRTEPQQCCSSEPPKLHHPPVDGSQSRLQQPHGFGSQSVQQRQNMRGSELCRMSSLQKKREYWKLMKRQQRAKLKVRQKERQGRYGSRPTLRSIQARGLGGNLSARPASSSKSYVSTRNTIPSIPNILVISPTSDNSGQTPDTIQVKLPVSSGASSPASDPFGPVEPSQFVPDLTGDPGAASALENCRDAPAGLPKWMFLDADLNPSLPTLKPPDNPLSSINLQNIQPLGQTISPIKTPQSPDDPKCPVTLANKLAPVSTMVPPKPIPGEPEEDFLKRKREYWRIKKKEQRARKAILNRDGSQRRASNTWQPNIQTQDTGDSDHWVSSSDGSERLSSSDADSFPSLSFSTPLEDSSEFLFANCGNSNGGEENSVYDMAWRSRYLMDYDPLNQLLVCIVCGELQYAHTVEGARAHIEDSHPDSLRLEPHERLRILESWDEQVSQRERFFSSQLQQRGAALTEAEVQEA